MHTTHWICAQHRSKSTWTNIQRGTVDITVRQIDKVVFESSISVPYCSGRGNSSYNSGRLISLFWAHHRQGGSLFCLFFDSSWQFNWTPTSSLLYITHWICAQHRSKSTCTNIQSETVDITTLQNDKVVLKLYITVSYLSGRGNYSYTSDCWLNSSQAHHRQEDANLLVEERGPRSPKNKFSEKTRQK